jgi:hypothetical protein
VLVINKNINKVQETVCETNVGVDSKFRTDATWREREIAQTQSLNQSTNEISGVLRAPKNVDSQPCRGTRPTKISEVDVENGQKKQVGTISLQYAYLQM